MFEASPHIRWVPDHDLGELQAGFCAPTKYSSLEEAERWKSELIQGIDVTRESSEEDYNFMPEELGPLDSLYLF